MKRLTYNTPKTSQPSISGQVRSITVRWLFDAADAPTVTVVLTEEADGGGTLGETTIVLNDGNMTPGEQAQVEAFANALLKAAGRAVGTPGNVT